MAPPTRTNRVLARTRAGRPNPERCAKFLDALREGKVIADALAIAALDKRSTYELRANDPEFAQQWESAIAEGVQLIQAKFLKEHIFADETDWRAMLAYLDRHPPEGWTLPRARNSVNITNAVGAAAGVVVPESVIAASARMLADEAERVEGDAERAAFAIQALRNIGEE